MRVNNKDEIKRELLIGKNIIINFRYNNDNCEIHPIEKIKFNKITMRTIIASEQDFEGQYSISEMKIINSRIKKHTYNYEFYYEYYDLHCGVIETFSTKTLNIRRILKKCHYEK